MDDVNMSSLICEEDITKELQQFNVKFEDSDVPSRCKLDLVNWFLTIVRRIVAAMSHNRRQSPMITKLCFLYQTFSNSEKYLLDLWFYRREASKRMAWLL